MPPELVDQLGRPFRRQDLTREIAGPTVTGVRQVLGGHPEQGLTPGRLAAILREAEDGDAIRYLELAEAMEEKDPHYRSVLGTRKTQVSQLDITVEPASDAAEDVADAVLVEEFVKRDELQDELCDTLDAIGKGFSVTEIIWETSERQWMPTRLEWRFPQWFEFDRNDGRTLLLKTDEGGREPLAPFKFIQHFHKSKSGLPIRGGLARVAAWGYLFKNYDIKDWVSFAETYGQPLRVGKYHSGATPDEKSILLSAVRNLGADAAAIVPEGMVIEFVEAKISGSMDLFEKLANYLDTQVSKAVLGQTTTTDAISGGHAVSKEHNEVRAEIERSDSRQLMASLNRDLVRPLVTLNRGPRRAYPRIVIGRPEQVNVGELASALKDLVPVGLKVSQSEVRRKIGMEEPDDESDILGALPAPKPGDTNTAKQARGNPSPEDPEGEEEDEDSEDAASAHRCPGCGVAVARHEGRPPRDVADDLSDRAEEELAVVNDALIDRLREIVAGAASLEEVAGSLLNDFPDIGAEDLADALRSALVVAELSGRSDIADQT